MTSSTETRPRHPAPDFAQQDTRFARAFDVLRDGIARHAFPGAAVAITHQGRLVALKGLGRFTYEPESPAVQPETIYDLASVTKAVATTTMAMILYERGQFDLDAPLITALPEFAGDDSRRQQVTFRMLLAHSSGLPAYERLFEKATGYAQMLPAILAVPLTNNPGTQVEYSDIGFLLLALAMTQITRWGFGSLCAYEIFRPLGMLQTTFRPHPKLRSAVPPTEKSPRFPGTIIQGEVNDENARAMGSEDPGHAGLFAPAEDVARFAECMLAGGRPILRPETVALFTRRQDSPPGTSRTLGWDTPSPPSQSGQYFSPRSFGHLGYTGTSLWIDPERRLSVTLLTNRTWPDRKSQLIKEVRPRFHDAVVECLEGRT
ncbi:MAG TPA: serine hydrolase domain-containing protein [Terriglobales bacterium]|nr:serine hydrolase domain-containing protein [Terriglobales bacterium]